VGNQEDTLKHKVKLADCSWIADTAPEGNVMVKIRSASKLLPAVFENNILNYADGISTVARGQSAVLYRDDRVLGGGIITEVK